MSIGPTGSGYYVAICDACEREAGALVWDDYGACCDEVHNYGGFVHTPAWTEPGTDLVLCSGCHRAYSSSLAEVEDFKFGEGDVLSIWAAKGWAKHRLAAKAQWDAGVQRLNQRFGRRAEEAPDA